MTCLTKARKSRFGDNYSHLTSRMTAHQRQSERDPGTTHGGYYTTLVAMPPNEPTPREPGTHYQVSFGLAACTSALARCLTLLQEREAIACGSSPRPRALGLVVSGRSPARVTSMKRPRQLSSRTSLARVPPATTLRQHELCYPNATTAQCGEEKILESPPVPRDQYVAFVPGLSRGPQPAASHQFSQAKPFSFGRSWVQGVESSPFQYQGAGRRRRLIRTTTPARNTRYPPRTNGPRATKTRQVRRTVC